MKILFVFWDMTRVNLLNKVDSENVATDIDKFLDEIGGTFYTNCYTPAPDTPRSLASMQSGLYPYSNGCDSRIKWPKFFLNEEKITIFDQFNKASFKQLFYLPDINYNVGPFSERAYKYGEFFNDRYEFKEAVKKNIDGDGNLFAHIHLDDYHWGIDDHGPNKRGVKIGRKNVVDFTESFFNDISINSFDYVFIFSDHGHKCKKETAFRNRLELLNGDRTNILMHIRRKDEYRVSKNTKLCAIFDIFPTIQEILKYNDVSNDGISLFSKKEHSEIIIEDHSKFNVEPIQGIEVWAIRKIKSLYITSIINDLYFENNIIKEISKSVKIENIGHISKKSPTIKDYQKKLKVLNYYKNLKASTGEFNNGNRRRKDNFFTKIIRFINNVIH